MNTADAPVKPYLPKEEPRVGAGEMAIINVLPYIAKQTSCIMATQYINNSPRIASYRFFPPDSYKHKEKNQAAEINS